MYKVLVLDCQMRSALAAIRSLGIKGVYVIGGEKTRFATSFFSKYCHEKVIYPNPAEEKNFVNFILNEIKKRRYDMLLPMTNETLIPLSKHKKEISKYVSFPFQNHKKLMVGFDKSKTMNFAKKIKIPIPKTKKIKKFEELKNFELPIVVKPIIGSGSRGLFIIKNKKDIGRLRGARFPCLLQEFIPNKEEVGVYTLFEKGEPIALSVQKRIRSYPINGGPSTLRETIEDEEATKLAFKLLKALKWDGIAMVEFRRDKRDNKLKLIEINPRFWGSLELSIKGGVNFPYILFKKSLNLKVKKDLNYKKGIKCRWLLPGDILWFVFSKKNLKNIIDFLKIKQKNMTYDIISKKDSGPTFGLFVAFLRYCLSKEMWRFAVRNV